MRRFLINTLGLVVITTFSFCLPSAVKAQEVPGNAGTPGFVIEGKREASAAIRTAKHAADDSAVALFITHYTDMVDSCQVAIKVPASFAREVILGGCSRGSGRGGTSIGDGCSD
jgi:hypothetical protein